MQINVDNIVLKLLISPRFRIFRHLILFIFVSFISAGSISHIEEEHILTPIEKFGGLSLFIFLFFGGSLLNIYVLTPKFLLKNKWGTYFLYLLIISLPIMTAIIMSQSIFGDDLDNILPVDHLTTIVTFISSTLALLMLFAGASTIILFKHWILDMQQAEELESTTLQLELKLLENQINPHFLFNMLNNAVIMTKKDPDMATHIIGKLEEMLRYQMNENTHEKVYLKDEISFLNDFLELEKTRRDYFDYTILLEGEATDIQIPPLLFISFVENAIKHNQDSRTESYVHIVFRITDNKLIFICENSIPQKIPNEQVGGIGLTNIKRRLNLLYKSDYLLEQTKTNTSYTVKLELKL